MEKIQISPNSFLRYYFFNKNIIVNVLFIIITLYLNSLYTQNYTLYTLDGKKKYTGYIITALIISILSLLINILSIIQYYTLFGPTISKTLLFLGCISIINIIIFIIVLNNLIKPVFKTPTPDPKKKSVCKVESQTYSCQQVDADDDKYKNYRNCSDQTTCIRYKQDSDKLLYSYRNLFLYGGCRSCDFMSYSSDSKKTKMIQEQECNLNKEIIDKLSKIDKNGKEEFPCPLGTKPYFFGSQGDLSYLCCDENDFKMTKKDCVPCDTFPICSIDPPVNKQYCLPDVYNLNTYYKRGYCISVLFQNINKDIWKANC